LFTRNENFEVEYRIQRKDGEWIWLHDRAIAIFEKEGVSHAFGVFLEITNRKQMEKELIGSKERLQSFMDEATDVFILFDSELNFVDLNTAALAAFPGGIMKNNIIGKNILDIIPEMKETDCYRKYLEVLKTGEPFFADDVVSNKLFGNRHLILQAFKAGNGLGIIGTDITAPTRQKEELSEFIHTMAHDLRNRLLSIEGFANMLNTEYNPAYAERIRRLAKNSSELLRRSVALADAGLVIEKTEEVDLTQLVQEVAKTTIPENISFKLDHLPMVAGDCDKLSQVFQNLLENAMTHGSPTKIEVTSQDVEKGTDIRVFNDGKSIPNEIRSKIFDRGFSTKAERSGLGLAIIQRIIDAHGWQISLVDKSETTFKIHIPA
ncbi:MAG: ATP-binding protein, partial [Candidatus Hodarchaeota archaeon]